MTTLLPGRCGGGMVKGLARFRNRLRHGRMAKHVDTGTSQEGGYSPMTARFYLRVANRSMPHCRRSGI